jgi:hypothetical protein
MSGSNLLVWPKATDFVPNFFVRLTTKVWTFHVPLALKSIFQERQYFCLPRRSFLFCARPVTL